MTPLRATCPALLAMALALALGACTASKPPPREPPPTKSFPAPAEVRESVYLPVARTAPPPAGYGLYTVLLTRTGDRNTLRLLSDLFSTTGSAGEAAITRENLNLITIPVKNTGEAMRTLATARDQPDVTSAALMQKSYDFGQAALLLASVCRAERGAAVMKVCGSAAPDGPLLVTTQRPLDATAAAGQRLLIVNLSTTSPEAVREVLAAYRRQILRRDFADRAELDGWRLWALNQVLDAAKLLPEISKAYAGR